MGPLHTPDSVIPTTDPSLPVEGEPIQRIPYKIWLKVYSRPIYFLSREHIVLLKEAELTNYIRKVWFWLVVNQHVGPLWLFEVVAALYSERLNRKGQIERTPPDEVPADVRELVALLKNRMA